MRERHRLRALMCAALALVACGRTDAERVAAASAHLESFAAEVRHLEELERSGAAPQSFLAVQRHLLEERVEQAAATLADASHVEGAVAQRRRAAIERARALELELAR